MKICFLDVETTGLSPFGNGIIQISGQLDIDGEAGDPFDFRVMPFEKDKITDSALKVNGIKREDICPENGYKRPEFVKGSLLDILGEHVDKFDKISKFHLAGYNVRFDDDFMRSWFRKQGDKFYGSWFWFPPIDIMNMAAVDLRYERKTLPDFKQATVAQHYGAEIDEARLHDAAYDIELARFIYYEIIGKRGAA